MLSILTETQKAIVETITMRLSPKQALEYLKDVGFEMSRAKYFRQKKKIQDLKFERMRQIAMFFQDQHLERIDRCETVEKLMWENYHLEKNPTSKVKILESIINMQPYLSSYYDATRFVMEAKCTTDIQKTPRPYVSIDVAEQRRQEVEKERENMRSEGERRWRDDINSGEPIV